MDELARKLARVHSLSVPIKKTGNWLFETIDNFFELAHQRFNFNQMLDEYNCETLKKYDLKQEIEWLKKCVLKTNSPILFCHNDFRGSNIMVKEINDTQNDSEDDKLVLCDFEYSSYGFRGIDFGTIFAEWGKSLSDFLKLHDFPDDSLIKPFILTYIEGSAKIHGKEYSENKLNSFEQILKEVKVFTLVSNLFDVTIILKFDESLDDIPLNKKQLMVWL